MPPTARRGCASPASTRNPRAAPHWRTRAPPRAAPPTPRRRRPPSARRSWGGSCRPGRADCSLMARLYNLAALRSPQDAPAMSSQKLWAGRFSEPTDAFVEAFTASVEFDQRLYRYDIEGSIAHARMLARQGILTEEERDAHRRRPVPHPRADRARRLRLGGRARGRPHERRVGPHRRYRHRRQEASHRALPQRPGRDRRAPVAARRDRAPSAPSCAACSAPCSTSPSARPTP